MTEREEIISDAIDEAVYLALEGLRTSDEEVKKATAERYEVSDWAAEDPKMDAYGQETLQRYLSLLDGLADKQYRHLYHQGAKDCIFLLRKMGVIT